MPNFDYFLFFQPINNSLAPTEYSLKESFGSPEPHIDQNDEEMEENILCSSELGSSHSLNYHHKNSVISVIENNNYNNQENQLEVKNFLQTYFFAFTFGLLALSLVKLPY